MIARVPLALRLLALFALQGLVLGWMIHDRAQILREGMEVRLAVGPVDPRDIFRGDYVTLSYDISQLDLPLLAGDDEFDREDEIFVVLRTDADGMAKAISVHRAYPDAPSGSTVIMGRVRYTSSRRAVTGDSDDEECPAPCPSVLVRYGIESYFVPEGQGRELESLREDQKVEVLAAVDKTGRPAIKGLIVEGKLRYEEPLF